MSGRIVDEETIDRKISVAVANGGGGGSSSYLVWDAAYQNSAMSSPVGAYLYKDASNNIWQAYEPIRNNVVSCSQFAYADSIDKVPFDNALWFDNTFNDVKLIDLSSNAEISRSNLETMVIDGNSFTGLRVLSTKWKGNLGRKSSDSPLPNDAELFISGNNVTVDACTFEVGAYIDDCGASSNIQNSYFMQVAKCTCNGGTISVIDSLFMQFAEAYLNDNTITAIVYDGQLGYISYVEFTSTGRTLNKCNLAYGATVTVNTNDVENSDVGMNCTITSAGGGIDAKRFINIAGTTYRMGVSGANMTLTAV